MPAAPQSAPSEPPDPRPVARWGPLAIDAGVLAIAAWVAFSFAVSTLVQGAALLALLLAWLVSARFWQGARPAGDPDEALGWLLGGALTVLGLVPTLAFFAHLLTRKSVDLPLLLGVTALVTLAQGAWLLRQPGRPVDRVLPLQAVQQALHHRGPELFACAGMTLLYLAKHDGSLPPMTCIGEAAWIAVGRNPDGIDLLRQNVGDAQLGSVGLLAGTLAALDAGIPLLYAACGGLMALAGQQAGVLAGGQRGWGWLGLLVLPLNPWIGSIPLVDENLLALAFGAPLLPLVLARSPRWFLLGALGGLVAAIRHPLVVAMPALAWPLWARWRQSSSAGKGPLLGQGPVRDFAALVLGFLAFTTLENAHHYLAFGSLLLFESPAQYPPFDYHLAGMPFRWQGLMNWPLHDHLVRTPHNPLPMWLGWPLHLLDHLGLLLGGAAALGLLLLRGPLAGVAVLWAVPVMLGLGLQEAWDYPNKMGVGVIVLPSVLLWAVVGLRWVLAVPWPRLAALAGVIGLLAVGARAAGHLQVPADERYFRLHHLTPTESQAHLAHARHRATDIALWPDLARFQRYGDQWALADKWRALQTHALSPAWGWFAHRVPPPGPPVTVELDLRVPPWQSRDFLRLTDAPPDLDLTRQAGLQVLEELPVSWERAPLTLTATRGRHLTLVEVGLRDFGQRETACDPSRQRCKCWYFETLERGVAQTACQGLTRRPHPGPIVRLRVPSGGLSFTANVNEVGYVVWLWRAEVGAAGVQVHDGVEFWHN